MLCFAAAWQTLILNTSHWGNHIRFTVRISAGPHSFSSLILRHVRQGWTETSRQKCVQIICFKQGETTQNHTVDKHKHRLGFNYSLQWFVIRRHYQVKQHCLPWLIKSNRWVLNITFLLCIAIKTSSGQLESCPQATEGQRGTTHTPLKNVKVEKPSTRNCKSILCGGYFKLKCSPTLIWDNMYEGVFFF